MLAYLEVVHSYCHTDGANESTGRDEKSCYRDCYHEVSDRDAFLSLIRS